ncbi:MAG: tRNA (adenosine(37)-N6)-dimethylallyltransferase MiaA [Desulfovibrionaceae bacterium]
MGATGTGKTKLALIIAEQCLKKKIPVAIINMDSRQVYYDFPIISAQPSPEDLALYHHKLYSYLNLDQTMRAGTHIKKVEQCLLSCNKEHILPILVGGTGLYFKALFSGLAPIPDIEEDLREEQREKVKEDIAQAYKELCKIDPKYASTIHSNDAQRIARALEVFYQTKRTLSNWHTETIPSRIMTQSYAISIPLSTLEKMLSQRVNMMLKNGAEEEVEKALRKSAMNTQTQGFSCIGAKELSNYILNKSTKEEAIYNWILNTRAYAKQQITWFKAQKDLHFFLKENEKSMSEVIMNNIMKEYKY